MVNGVVEVQDGPSHGHARMEKLPEMSSSLVEAELLLVFASVTASIPTTLELPIHNPPPLLVGVTAAPRGLAPPVAELRVMVVVRSVTVAALAAMPPPNPSPARAGDPE